MVTLPLFPLNTVLFPGVPLQLHIFEPRYQLMIQYCLENRQAFGVVLIQSGHAAGSVLPEPVQVGCSARITEITPLENGRMNLVAQGDDRFRIININHDHPYRVGNVEGLPLERAHSIAIIPGLRRLVPWIKHYLQLIDDFEGDRIT